MLPQDALRRRSPLALLLPLTFAGNAAAAAAKLISPPHSSLSLSPPSTAAAACKPVSSADRWCHDCRTRSAPCVACDCMAVPDWQQRNNARYGANGQRHDRHDRMLVAGASNRIAEFNVFDSNVVLSFALRVACAIAGCRPASCIFALLFAGASLRATETEDVGGVGRVLVVRLDVLHGGCLAADAAAARHAARLCHLSGQQTQASFQLQDAIKDFDASVETIRHLADGGVGAGQLQHTTKAEAMNKAR